MHDRTQQARAAFNEAYASLNTAQKQAVDTIEGPVMVVAGPGTGKTQILTLRIAKILLETDMQPNNILALTFTDAGAQTMRQRLHQYIGAQAYQVGIYTFHSFAQRLIREYPDAYTRVLGGRPSSDLDTITMIETILENGQCTLLRPIGNPSYYVHHIKEMISALKKEYITPDGFADIIASQEEALLGIEKIHQKGAHKGKVRSEYAKKETSIAKNKELLLVYRLYESLLTENRLYDFEDMIVQTVTALQSNEDMLRDLQETYQYILADEHQDVNGSQNRILELLCNFHDFPNIFVVGDEKQAIFRFQGASLENFLYFEDIFPHTVRISLTENYRSGQTILDAAHSLVAVGEGLLATLRVPLTAQHVSASVVIQRDFSHQAVEDAALVSQIQQLIEQGTPLPEIAVIVRTNKEVEQFSALLRKKGITVAATADGDILDHPITGAIQSFIDAVVHRNNQEALFTLLHGAYWGIGTNDLIKITSARSYKTSLWSIISDEATLQALEVEHIDAVTHLVQTLEAARKREISDAPHRVLEYMLQESGFLNHVLAHDPQDSARVVRRVYDEVEKMVLYDKKTTLREISGVLSRYREHRIALTAPYITPSTSAVQVMTAHKSKGLEFTAVFVPHAVDSVWGGTQKRTYFDVPLLKHSQEDGVDALDDERRLLYVSMTRAKEYLCLSYANQNTEGKPLIATRLFDAIDERYITHEDTAMAESAFDPLATITQKLSAHTIDAQVFSHHLQSRGLSATALNNYLRSPYDYLYRNVLRIPEVQALPLQFGTAIHGVMEWVSAYVAANGAVPSVLAIKQNLGAELSRLPITDTEFTQLHEKGFAALTAYMQHAGSTIPKDSKVEFSVAVLMETGIPDFPELSLTGKLDRLDFDKQGNVVRVVDYKTGKPKTRNDIEGKTQSSNGDYKRQLTFYALLLSLYGDQRYACNTGVLSFIEPDAKGVIHEEIFEITAAEIEALKEEIIRVAKEIISGSFLDTPCDDTTSSYCHLARLL